MLNARPGASIRELSAGRRAKAYYVVHFAASRKVIALNDCDAVITGLLGKPELNAE
ncbi:hypothetical protein Hte_010058 [Hypoxylon texense]